MEDWRLRRLGPYRNAQVSAASFTICKIFQILKHFSISNPLNNTVNFSTKFMKQSPLDADRWSRNCLLSCPSKIHYFALQNSSPLGPILSQIISVLTLKPYLFKINFDIIPSYMFMSPKWSPPLRNFICVLHVPNIPPSLI
jgi:hypothetical protein